jgi:uncharacterized protein (TIGR02996 family)
VTETEAAIQAWLDAHPDDGTARQHLADHLDDEGDERAAGYRELGRLGLVAKYYPGAHEWTWWRPIPGWSEPHYLPDEWWDELNPTRRNYYSREKNFHTRREAEDAAALAFARLPVPS